MLCSFSKAVVLWSSFTHLHSLGAPSLPSRCQPGHSQRVSPGKAELESISRSLITEDFYGLQHGVKRKYLGNALGRIKILGA